MKKNQVLVGVLLIASLALIVLGVAQLSSGAGVAQQPPPGPTPTTAQVTRITPQELNKKLKEPNPPQVWDLRAPGIFADAHIPNSQLVPFNDVAAIAEKLDRKQAIVAL